MARSRAVLAELTEWQRQRPASSRTAPRTFFVLALPLYIWYRWTHTVAWTPTPALRAYQAAVALVELLAAFRCCCSARCASRGRGRLANPQPPQTEVDASDPESIRGFQVSILIPCYSEPDEIILGAVRAALGLRHPLASRVTVYLLDDGGRLERAAAVRARRAVREPAEGPSKPRHGKAGNLNYFFRGVLCGGANPLCEGGVPGPEHVVAVFDCDMEAHADFLGHTLPYLAAEPRVALVQTPQAFFNVAPAADIFNHNNVGFFQAVQPGLDAWGATVCCGTNFAVRAARSARSAGSPPSRSPRTSCSRSLAAAATCAASPPSSRPAGARDLRQIFKQRERWCRLLPGLLTRDVGDAARLRWPQKLCFLNAPVATSARSSRCRCSSCRRSRSRRPVRALTPVLLWWRRRAGGRHRGRCRAPRRRLRLRRRRRTPPSGGATPPSAPPLSACVPAPEGDLQVTEKRSSRRRRRPPRRRRRRRRTKAPARGVAPRRHVPPYRGERRAARDGERRIHRRPAATATAGSGRRSSSSRRRGSASMRSPPRWSSRTPTARTRSRRTPPSSAARGGATPC